MHQDSPFSPFLTSQGVVILDGGLATELENRGHNLDHALWSARLLLSQPGEIRAVQRAYLEAGADCIASATYQSTLPGLQKEGLTATQAMQAMADAVALTCDARDEFWESCADSARHRPLVAASIGPYGAYLADGSEFRGDYGLSVAELRAFHEPRWQAFANSQAEVLACETIPDFSEAQALRQLFDDTPDLHGWVSFSCKDGVHISDGTPLSECAALFRDCPQVAALGINCTPPRFMEQLIEQIKQGAPEKLVAVYPNSGETYDGEQRVWRGQSDSRNFADMALRWRASGANLIGGCCRTGPGHIRAIRAALSGK